MKIRASVALVAILIAGCDILGPKSVDNRKLNATFSLTDMSRRPATVFHSGQDFIMAFSVVNTTSIPLTYSYSEPPVIFWIHKDSDYVASSIDGFAFPMVINGAVLAPGERLSCSWKAPITIGQDPKVVLAPGIYEASVSFPQFNGARVNPLATIPFVVVQ